MKVNIKLPSAQRLLISSGEVKEQTPKMLSPYPVKRCYLLPVTYQRTSHCYYHVHAVALFVGL